MATPIVEARGLVKRFGDIVAVDGIDFSVVPGECFGLLGPNGSGKTSTLRMIGCVSPVTAGALRVCGMRVGERPRRIRGLLGVVPQEENLDDDLTVLQNLMVYSRYFNLPRRLAMERALESLEFFQLQERRHSRIEELSGGMKRRLLIARALIHGPRLLLLDEPTTGLDPQARHLMWDRLLELKGRGITMLLSTHYMEEAAYLCDRLVILDRGQILVEGIPQDLIRRYAGGEVVEVQPGEGQREEILRLLAQQGMEFQDGRRVIYVFSRDGRPLAEELRGAAERVTYRSANLEDVYLHLTGRGLREEL